MANLQNKVKSDDAKGSLILFLTAFIWGFCLVGQATGMEVMGPLSFSAVRLTLGGVSMLPLVLILDRRKVRRNPDFDLKADWKASGKAAAICAPVIWVTIMLQQYGLLYTSVGKCAFVTAFYIFLVPLFGIPLGRKVSGKMWAAVGLAMAGLYLITMHGGIEKVNIGDMICLCAAVTYSVDIHMIETFAARVDKIKMSCIQFTLCGLLSYIGAVIFEPGQITWAHCVYSMVPILVTGIVSCAVGFTLQMIGQIYTGPSKASLILSSETLFSLLAGMIFLGESMVLPEYCGCAVMSAAILMAVRS